MDNTIRRRVLVGTLSNYVNKFVALTGLFFLTPFILREIGSELFGLWTLVGSVVAYGALLDFGIATAVTKYVAEFYSQGDTEKANSLIATSLWLYSGIGFSAIVLSGVLAYVFPFIFNIPVEQHDLAMWMVLLSGIGLGISLPAAIGNAILKGLQRYDLANAVNTIGFLIYIVSVVIVLLLGGGILGIVAINIPLTILLQIPTIWLVKRSAPELRFSLKAAKAGLVRAVASFSSALFIINIAEQLQTKTDEIVIGSFMPIRNVTPYAISRRLSETPRMLSDQFIRVLLPVASQLNAEKNQDQLRRMYLASTRIGLASFLPVATGVAVLAAPFLTAWVGAEFAQYAYLVWILALASLFATSQWPAGVILQGMSKHRYLAFTSLASGLANLILSLILVQRIGLLGVALGTLIPVTIEALFFVLPYAMREIGVRPWEAVREMVLPALVPTIPMFIVLYLLRETLRPGSIWMILFVAGIGLLVYLVGYLSMKATTLEREFGRDLAVSLYQAARSHLRSISGS
jgi:O-antigen/teichoic acid export membrane protein